MTTRRRKRRQKYDIFYVVTRNGRRVEENNYWTYEEAEGRASKLRFCLRKWGDRDSKKVEIIKTQDPASIY